MRVNMDYFWILLEGDGARPPLATEGQVGGYCIQQSCDPFRKTAELYHRSTPEYAQRAPLNATLKLSLQFNTMRFRHSGLIRLVSALMLLAAMSLCAPVFAQDNRPDGKTGQNPPAVPEFTDEDALTIFDSLQAALESYNRKRFLSAFDSAHMPNFAAFQDQIKSLFDRYDSFTVTYRLAQTAVENSTGVALADFGLDATSNAEELPDLRRHTELRIVTAWNGKEWKIVDLTPRAVFR
jgi:hypothetical protein